MSLKDPRVVDWPLMSSPWPTAAICVLYVIGPYHFTPK